MQLVATTDIDCYFDFDAPFVQGHIIPFLLVTCLWNLFISQLLILVMFIQIFKHVKFAENKLRTSLFLLSLEALNKILESDSSEERFGQRI